MESQLMKIFWKIRPSRINFLKYYLLGVAFLPLYGIGIFVFIFIELLRCYERYSINDENMAIEKGIFSKNRQAFKISDIKSVHIEQNWIERLLRVGALWISVGNTSGHQIVLKGIRNPVVFIHKLSKS
jgi:uncharacterized membrane protein YdbT with pleckstrin-like domain